jgi:serine/threonine protein kinase
MSLPIPNKTEISRLGSYTYEKYLGHGAYGETWKALFKPNNGQSEYNVAIKVYKNSDSLEDVKEDLEYEVGSLKALTESGVCKEWAVCYIDSFLIKNKFPRLVMEYINGEPLDVLISKITLKKRLKSIGLIHDLVIGLNVLHNAGIAHQDIKEANIMLDRETNRYKFIDWGNGCVKSVYCNAKANICIEPCGYRGTLYTAPPELPVDAVYMNLTFNENVAHDIWSIGVVLYNWYTWDKSVSKNYFDKNLRDLAIVPDLIRNVNYSGRYGNFIKQIITKLLQVNVKDRLKSWQQVVDMVIEKSIPRHKEIPKEDQEVQVVKNPLAMTRIIPKDEEEDDEVQVVKNPLAMTRIIPKDEEEDDEVQVIKKS